MTRKPIPTVHLGGDWLLLFRLQRVLLELFVLVEMEELDRVPGKDRILIFSRNSFEVTFEEVQGVRPVGLNMREVASPHHFVDADFVANSHTQEVVKESPDKKLFDVFAP